MITWLLNIDDVRLLLILRPTYKCYHMFNENDDEWSCLMMMMVMLIDDDDDDEWW